MEDILYIEHHRIAGNWQLVWKIKCPPKVKERQVNPTQVQHNIVWKRPPIGSLKRNMDLSFSRSPMHYSLWKKRSYILWQLLTKYIITVYLQYLHQDL
jgi:hypothetical protein